MCSKREEKGKTKKDRIGYCIRYNEYFNYVYFYYLGRRLEFTDMIDKHRSLNNQRVTVSYDE